MNTTKANSMASAAINRYPHLKEQIIESWELMSDEISDGGSEAMEVERFLEELKLLTKEEV
jgi:hypothetical protein